MAKEMPRTALAGFLREAFSAAELRIWVAGLDGGDELLASVAITEATPINALLDDLVKALDRRGALDASFFAALHKARPKKRTEIAAVQALFAPEASTGAPPLLESRHGLDRYLQWADVQTRSLLPGHQLFLLHGPPNQHLEDFTERVKRFLNEPRGGAHQLFVVSASAEGFERPDTPEVWERRFAAQLGKHQGLVAHRALRDSAQREPVFVLLGARPLNPRILPEDDLEALCAFLAESLGPIVKQAAPAHPLRLYLAVAEAASGLWTARLLAALHALADALDATFVDTARVRFPPFEPDVRMYVQSLGLRPPPSEAWWAKLKGLHEEHASDGGHYREFCSALDEMLSILPRKTLP